MRIKIAVAVTAGIAATAIAGTLLWVFTSMELLHMAAWMLVVYAATVSGVLVVADGLDIVIRVRHRSRGPQIYDLRDYPEWREKERRR